MATSTTAMPMNVAFLAPVHGGGGGGGTSRFICARLGVPGVLPPRDVDDGEFMVSCA